MTVQVYLSPSKSATMGDCMAKFFLQYIAKVKTKLTSPNLIFGECYDEVWNEFLIRTVHMKQSFDLEALFLSKWAKATSRSIQWSMTKDKATMEAIGVALVKAIPKAWEDSGFTLLLDRNGDPVIQRNLVVDLGNGVINRMKLDLVVLTRDFEVAVIDNKTAATASGDVLGYLEQVVDYQVAVDALALQEGWSEVKWIGYWEAIKQKTKPRIDPPFLRPAATPEKVQQRIRKLHYQAKLIRMNEFHRETRMSYNSPCKGMCDYEKLCHFGDSEDMIIPMPEMLKQIGITLVA